MLDKSETDEKARVISVTVPIGLIFVDLDGWKLRDALAKHELQAIFQDSKLFFWVEPELLFLLLGFGLLL